ncbi:hybrid sensor histidine kinase/response regulator transcription factor [Spirosoma arcticum]
MRLLFLLLLIPFALFAQSASHRTAKGWQELTISDGLSQGMIFDLEQDRNGFIWVATKDGLNRYDGHNFTVFTHDPYNAFSISDNTCSALMTDRNGRLWIGTLNQGLNLFNDRSGRFYHLNITDRTAPNAGNYEIQCLAQDPDGDIWVGTDKGRLFRIRLPESIKTGFPDQPDFTDQVRLDPVSLVETKAGISSTVQHIRFRPDGQAVVGSTVGLFGINWRRPAKSTRLNESTANVPDLVYAFYGDAKQDFRAAVTMGYIICWQRGIRKTIALPKKEYAATTLRLLDEHTVVVATSDYLWMMSPDELMRQDSLTSRNAFATLPEHVYATTDLIKDRTGSIWVGTSGYGLRKFNPRVKQFGAYLPNTTLSYLFADRQGNTYVRHEFAYGRLNRATNRMEPFLSNTLPAADKRQRFLMQDRAGNFWASNVHFQTHVQHLFKFSSNWQLLKKYPMPANTSFGFFVNQTVEDQAGRLWIGGINGKLLRFDPGTEAFTVFDYQALLPQGEAEIATYALYFDQGGTLWIGTQAGLIRADHHQTTPTFTCYKNDRTNRRSLSYDVVSSLIDDPDQPARYLWAGTKGGGLERLDKQTGQFEHVTEAQGLPNNVVYGILVDEFKNLWLSTNRGLAQYDPRSRKFRNYTDGDGLQDNEFNTGSYFKTASGELLFGGVNGLTAFRSGAVVGRTGPAPQAHIIGLKVNNEPVGAGGSDGILPERIEHTQRLDLAHTQNGLTLEFGVMDYTNSAKNRYRYRLNGIDRDWVEAGTNRFANYAQLPAGDYTFQMIGSADGEVWSKPATLQIQIRPPVYRTWWAYLLYALAIGAIAWQLYRFQRGRLLLQQRVAFEQQEAGRLAELDRLKTQFFTNISHELRTPLTLILGPVEDVVTEYAHDSRFPLIQRNARRLLSLINQLLDLSKLEAGQLRPEPKRGDIAAFLRTLASSFTSLAASQQLEFTFAQNKAECWTDFDADKIEKIVTNLLANAVKFTPPGNDVRMTVRYPEPDEAQQLHLTIADTGIGIAPEHLTHIFERFYQRTTDAADGPTNRPHEGTGIGLALVHELVRVLDGRVGVTSTVGQGTTFTVTLPFVNVDKPALAPVSSPAPALADIDPPVDWPMASTATELLHVPGGPIGIAPANSILLVIDDNADIRAYVRSIFGADYQIIEAADGQQGLEQATAILPDVVICDLMMPRLDGFGFCRALKTQDATSHIPVVMLTAKATVGDRIEGFELGADDYLTKPFNRAELRARVRNLVEQRERLYQRFATSRTLNGHAPAAGPSDPPLLRAEQQFLDRLTGVVTQQIDNADFTVEALAEGVHMSRTQLHRKLKALTNTSATNFIRDLRLAKAAELLRRGDESVTQVAYAVGYDNLSYFAKVFQEQHGVLPSQYGKSETPVS